MPQGGDGDAKLLPDGVWQPQSCELPAGGVEGLAFWCHSATAEPWLGASTGLLQRCCLLERRAACERTIGAAQEAAAIWGLVPCRPGIAAAELQAPAV